MRGRPPGLAARRGPERGAVDYGAAALRAHVAKLVLHAGPDTAKIDGVHAIELLGRFIGRVTRRNLYTGIVERHVQAAEAGACALMSASTTAAPASATALTVLSPMPELAPVTRATWPLKS